MTTHKIGRNDPCPCGSGRKYKQCCSKKTALPETPADSHEDAVARALAWLAQHHRKALAVALEEAIDDAIAAIFDDEDEARAAVAGIDEELWIQIQLNLTEWLLAEGDIEVKGEFRQVADLVLGPGGPLLTVAQRGWLEQLAKRPLRLYDVTEVVPGASITLCDALLTEAPPVMVVERSGSCTLRAGMQIGARVMELPGEHQLSGAIYPFSMLGGQAIRSRLHAMLANEDAHEDDDIMMVGLALIDGWLAQHLAPAPLPEIVDATSGEPLLFATDHYEVRNWAALAAALAGGPDVRGDRNVGWDRLIDGDDGQTRPQATIAAEPGGRRVSVFYRTAGQAERGRPWFDALAGDAVKFLLHEVSDPKRLLSRGALKSSPAKRPGLPDGMDPEVVADIIEAAILRSYAHWADEPIPALNNQTPRQAIQSAAGLERVKGLLRSYEGGEAQQAAQQGRREISYQFLWDALGLAR
jgi:hypothetical protein